MGCLNAEYVLLFALPPDHTVGMWDRDDWSV